MKIVIPKSEALGHLNTNYKKHKKEYDAQVKGWKWATRDWAYKVTEWAEGPADPGECPRMPYRPIDHRNDYRTLIRMVGSHSMPDIELDERDYQKVVLDNFEWRERFLGTTMVYGPKGEKS